MLVFRLNRINTLASRLHGARATVVQQSLTTNRPTLARQPSIIEQQLSTNQFATTQLKQAFGPYQQLLEMAREKHSRHITRGNRWTGGSGGSSRGGSDAVFFSLPPLYQNFYLKEASPTASTSVGRGLESPPVEVFHGPPVFHAIRVDTIRGQNRALLVTGGRSRASTIQGVLPPIWSTRNHSTCCEFILCTALRVWYNKRVGDPPLNEEIEMNQDDLIKAVRAHGIRNYEEDGWDVLVECWSDDDIVDAIQNAKTVAIAIKRVAKVLTEYNSYIEDIQASAF